MKLGDLVERLLLSLLLIYGVFASLLASAGIAPTGVAMACIVSPDAPSKPLEIRVEPRGGSRVAGLLPAPGRIARLDTESRAGGDWIQVEAEGVKGWVEGKLLVCRMPVEQAREIISSQASRVVELLKQHDLRGLSQLVHPVKGIRFSPYAFLDRKINISFVPATLPGALRETRKRVWGTYDGSGAPIRLTFAEYYQRFVYDRDFAAATKIFYNEEPIARGNTRDNSFEEYPNAIIVEYYMPGVRPEQEGMDWASLRLVFEQHRAAWYLVHVIHDQWTI